MLNYIKAEHLKTKRTFLRWLIWIAPLITLTHAIMVIAVYFISDAYNWWYIVMLPATVALVCALMNRYEERKLQYRAVLSLPVSLKKVWVSKVVTASGYVILASTIQLCGILLVKLFVHTGQMELYSYAALILESIVLIVTVLWQVPLCLLLAKKFGMLAAVLFNALGGILLSIIASTTRFWWICPYSFGARLTIPILGVLPNGLIAEQGDSLLSGNVILPGIVISVLLFIALSLITANWFGRQEVQG